MNNLYKIMLVPIAAALGFVPINLSASTSKTIQLSQERMVTNSSQAVQYYYGPGGYRGYRGYRYGYYRGYRYRGYRYRYYRPYYGYRCYRSCWRNYRGYLVCRRVCRR